MENILSIDLPVVIAPWYCRRINRKPFLAIRAAGDDSHSWYSAEQFKVTFADHIGTDNYNEVENAFFFHEFFSYY